VVEGSGLENRQAFTRLEGSNPSLSAKIPLDSPDSFAERWPSG
jgi:hypothetical protein